MSRSRKTILGPTIVLVCVALAGPAWAESAPNCALELDISAHEEDSLEIRQRLSGGLLGEIPAENCDDVLLHITRDETGYTVTLEQGEPSQGSEHIQNSREVVSLDHAAMWVESWLAPAPTSHGPRQRTSEGSFRTIESSRNLFPDAPVEAPHQREVRLELSMPTSLTGDTAVWLGFEFSVAALLTRAFWLGGGFGVIFWAQPQNDTSGQTNDSPVIRPSIRLGGQLHLGNRLALDLGTGIGLTYDSVLTEKFNPFVELIAELDVVIVGRLSFNVALLGRGHILRTPNRSALARFDREGTEIDTITHFAGEIRIGFSYSFGRDR